MSTQPVGWCQWTATGSSTASFPPRTCATSRSWTCGSRAGRRTVFAFRQKVPLEDAIGPHACSVEARAGV
jgi:hypothetical protein